MRCSILLFALTVAAGPLAQPGYAQRHNGTSSPPTAPRAAPAPLVPVSSGLGAIQFVSVNYGVPAPQSLTRQLRSDDERTRAAALSALGVPGQYLQRGHIATPHSIELELVSLSNTDDPDALLTVELDQHIVTGVLVPDDGGNWHRVATLFVADSSADPSTTPSTFVRTAQSALDRNRYSAIFHANSTDAKGNYIENEAQLRIFNNKPDITVSFASASRDCNAPPPVAGAPAKHPDANASAGCNIMHRWLQTDPADPTHHFVLVTGSGHLSPHEASGPLGNSQNFDFTHLRSFTCQPFQFSESTTHFEPTGPNIPCPSK